MDQNNGLKAKISKEETWTLATIGLEEAPLLLTRNSLPDRTLHMGTTIRIMDDHKIIVPISHSIEAMETDLRTVFSTIRLEIGETMEDPLVLPWLRGETFHKIFHIANQEKTNLTTLPSADLKFDLWVVLRLTNKNFHKTITRHHLTWFASPQPMISLMNYHVFSR